MDCIRIVGINISAKHGFYAEERLKGNNFEVDVEAILKHPLSSMSKPSDSFDYESANQVVKEVFEGESQLFLEELALKIGNKLWNSHNENLKSILVNVRKMNPPVSIPSSYSEVSLCWPRSI